MKKTYWIIAAVLVLVGVGVFGGYRYLQNQVQPLSPEGALPPEALFMLAMPDWQQVLTLSSQVDDATGKAQQKNGNKAQSTAASTAATQTASQNADEPVDAAEPSPIRLALDQTGVVRSLRGALQPWGLQPLAFAAGAAGVAGAAGEGGNGAAEQTAAQPNGSPSPDKETAAQPNGGPSTGKLAPNGMPRPEAKALLVGGYITGAGTFDLILVMRDKEKVPRSLQPFEKYEGISLYKSDVGGKTWYEFRHRGLRVGSFSRVLLEDAIRYAQGKSNSQPQPGLERLRTLAGKGAEPTLYLNLPELAAFLGMFVQPEYAAALQGFGDFCGWLALDLQVKGSALILGGYAAPGEADQLARFSKQDTAVIQVEKVLPLNTGLLWRMGGEASSLFRPDFLKATEGLGDPWLEFQGGEWAYALIETLSDSPDRSALFALRLRDVAAAETHLANISIEDGKIGNLPVRRLNGVDPVISQRFGRSLSAFDQSWFAIVDRYLLMAPERATLEHAADQYAQSQTLHQDQRYLAFRQRLLPSANAYLYFSMPGLIPLAQNLASDRSRDSLRQGMELLQAFQPFALQFDRYRDLFLTSGFVDYGARSSSGEQQLWALQLDTTLASAPRVVIDHRDGKNEWLLEDHNHNLYLVDRGGKIQWRRALNQPILGDVQQIDYYKNGKLQYLFATSNKLHLIDRNGQNVADFPINLTVGAGVGVSVFDYENKRDYRIFVGSTQENIYGYYPTGKPLPGWSPMKKAGPLAQPILHAVQADRDFLVLVSQSGKVSFKDRKGDDRFPAVTLDAPLLGPLVVDRGGPEPLLVGCDTLGNLVRISFGGLLERLPLPNVRGNSLFALRDLNGTGPAELLIVTGNTLVARDLRGQQLWTATLPDEGPHVWAAVADPRLAAVWSPVSKEWNAFNATGEPLPGFPMVGEGPFTVAPLSGAEEKLLLGARGTRVIARKLE